LRKKFEEHSSVDRDYSRKRRRRSAQLDAKVKLSLETDSRFPPQPNPTMQIIAHHIGKFVEAAAIIPLDRKESKGEKVSFIERRVELELELISISRAPRLTKLH